MGLDMYFDIYKKDDNVPLEKLVNETSPISREFYWRDAWQVNYWIKNHAEPIEKDGSRYLITKGLLLSLLTVCQYVQRSPEDAERFLPAGSTKPEEYFKIIDGTVTICSELLRNLNFKEELLIYFAWW